MSEFKTKAEIAAASEFIQYLEQLKSGSLAGNQGTNRALERLALNLDAVLEAVQGAKSTFMSGGGSISFASNTLTWTSNITLYFPGELNLVNNNVITAGSISSLTVGKILYTVLNRTTSGASISISTAGSMSSFLAILAGSADRLDYLALARVTSDGITFFNGQRIVSGYALNSDGYVDTQYGQQTELTLVHTNQKENLRILLTGGGNLSWDLSATEFSWSSALYIEFPTVLGNNRIQSSSSPVVIPAGNVMYVTLSRSPSGITNVTPAVAAIGSVPDTDDTFVVAIHKAADSRLYLWNGQALSDGETILLGSARTGVQWMYADVGAGTRTTDFTVGGSFPTRAYRVGSNELLVFRNGLKARPSRTAYWSGTYPAGALVGVIGTDDWYLEENSGSGTGSRILWLRDDGTATGHATDAHDPPWVWPQSDDYVEALIGVQGDGPSPVESVGIYPEPGSGPLENDVKLKAGSGVTLSYDLANNAITVAAAATAGVASLALSGGTGPQGGAVVLLESTTVDISEPATAQFKFDVKAPFSSGLLGSSTPSTTNPYVTHADVAPLQGFDVVWCTEGSGQTVYAGGGVLLTNGVAYVSNQTSGTNGRVEFDSGDVYGSDTLTPNTWCYAYLYPAVFAGNKPRAKISSSPPNSSLWGTHPSDSTYKYLTSVFVSGTGVKAFVKSGSWVDLGFDHDISAAFSSLTFSGVSTYADVSLAGTYIPVTTRFIKVRMRVNLDTGAVAIDDRVEVRVKAKDFGSSRSYFATRGSASTVDFYLDLMLNPSDVVSISGSADIDSVADVQVLGYSEGRYTAATNMGA